MLPGILAAVTSALPCTVSMHSHTHVAYSRDAPPPLRFAIAVARSRSPHSAALSVERREEGLAAMPAEGFSTL